MVGQVLIATGVMTLLFIVAIVVVGVSVVRGVRRRYVAARARLQGVGPRGVGPRAGAARSDVEGLRHRPGSTAAASMTSPGWWAVQNRRHRMWRAVTGAEYAVGVAVRSDAAVGDLPELARRLRAAATGVDAVLRASGGQEALRAQDRADCDRIVSAASDLRDAALSSLRVDSHADTETIVSAVRLEVAALAAGFRAAQN